ncbi:MAG: pantetheine-phosphate adenylyltransferase [Oscillospiraceae bacterium]|jgi:pantetheine-phosphate adenylyltransferase|nr:pantetheine-phosphate adenylyltransferase [Oscillospiraceae bacterium]
MSTRIALYPGSFDPITLGHLNIIRRAARVFDKIIVCVMVNSSKTPLFTLEERVELIERTVSRLGNVEVESSDGLLVKHAKEVGANVIIKGLRAVSDFDWEFQMALANKVIEPEIETLFMTSSSKYTYLSSTVVREMARHDASIDEFVPREIIQDILNKVNQK